MTDDREKARLEAIVFGRDAAVTDAEREAAAEALERLLEHERARDAAAHEADPLALELPQASPSPEEPEAEVPTEVGMGTARSARRRRRWRIAGFAAAAVVVAVVALGMLVTGRFPFAASDPLALFDRPQTEQELLYATRLGYPFGKLETFRYVQSDGGFDVYIYQEEPPEQRPNQETFYCALLDDGQEVIRLGCTTADAFSSGPVSTRTSRDGGWIEATWSSHSGVTVTTGTNAPVPPPLSVFDEEQDEADLNALAYLPDIPSSQQDSVRFLSSSGGYYVAAYRYPDEAVCLAVYQGGTVVATSESVCVTETEFESAGIQLLYPTAAPEISVTWGPTGVAFSGR
jgi:hypothetical protein